MQGTAKRVDLADRLWARKAAGVAWKKRRTDRVPSGSISGRAPIVGTGWPMGERLHFCPPAVLPVTWWRCCHPLTTAECIWTRTQHPGRHQRAGPRHLRPCAPVIATMMSSSRPRRSRHPVMEDLVPEGAGGETHEGEARVAGGARAVA